MYRIWVQIEEIEEDRDVYQNVALPDPAGSFDELEDAQKQVRAILQLTNPDAILTSDQV